MIEFANTRTRLFLALVFFCAAISAGVVIPILVLLTFVLFPGIVSVGLFTYWIMGIGFVMLLPSYFLFRHHRKRFEDMQKRFE